VNRIQKTLASIAILAVPAAATSAFTPQQNLCFRSGAAAYRIAANAARPDYRIKIADDAPHADLRMQWVDRAELADFVFIDGVDDDSDASSSCTASGPARTVTASADMQRPDVTVALAADAATANYRLYVRSTHFSRQDAAALVAAIWKADKRRETAAQTLSFNIERLR